MKHYRQAKISEIAATIAQALASTQLSSNADVLTESIYQVLQSNEDKTRQDKRRDDHNIDCNF